MEIEYFQFTVEGKYGIKTLEGRIVIPAKYDFISAISNGLFTVQNNKSYAYFDEKGNMVLPFENRYESYGEFSEGLARVYVNEKYGYIDKTGKEVIKPQFHFADDFSNDMAIVGNRNGKQGAIDKKGNLVIAYQFDIITKFENGYASFGDSDTWGLMDKTGKIILPQEYMAIASVRDSKVIVQKKDGEIYREGVFTMGGSIEWNNNLDYLNEYHQKRKEFALAAETMIQEMYKKDCPCKYERFRNYIQWDKPFCFEDQELLFSVFRKHLKKTDENNFECTHCGTKYKQSQEKHKPYYSVVLNVTITQLGPITEKGALLKQTIPLALGFYGDWDKPGLYTVTSYKAVISYLREKRKGN